MNVTEINKSIKELENGQTTYSNCEKLACLYIVREYIVDEHTNNVEIIAQKVEKEYQDILPQYKNYVKIKSDFYFNKVTEKAIEKSINLVCNEIIEFIHSIYSSTDTQIERDVIHKMITKLAQKF